MAIYSLLVYICLLLVDSYSFVVCRFDYYSIAGARSTPINPSTQLTTSILRLCDMADTSKLWFYIHGKNNLSYVSVSLDETIFDLKNKIHTASPNSFAGCDAVDLILTKVRFIMVSMNTGVTKDLCWPITPVGRYGPSWDSQRHICWQISVRD